MFFITKVQKIENTKGMFVDGRANLTFGFLFRVFVPSCFRTFVFS